MCIRDSGTGALDNVFDYELLPSWDVLEKDRLAYARSFNIQQQNMDPVSYTHLDVYKRQVHAHEQDIARLRVGEHAAATDVGIHVHEATDQRQDDAELDRLGYLLRALHAPFPLTSAQRRSCTAYAMPNLNFETVSPDVYKRQALPA